MGTALRNLVKTCRARKITLGGRKTGSLKGTTIKTLTKYYGNAVRKHSNVAEMKTATLDHCGSTNENPQYEKCPKGGVIRGAFISLH